MAQDNDGRAAARPCIAIVEDEASVRRSLQLLLRSHGFDVRAYPTAAQATGDPEMAGADCFIVDLMLPGGDGIALLGDVRAGGWNGPAILISAYVNDSSVARAHACGFDEVLAKPFAEGKLVDLVRRLTATDHPDGLLA